tara:strand:- start:1242 stop:2510 length:1269 start_codon:yes stop_codon:yes gene_type:complete
MKQKDFVNYILFVFILFSFFLGFYLDEDSAGGGKIDLIQNEWGNIKLFKSAALSEALTSLEYKSSRNPLFLIIHKYNFLANDINGLRISTFITGIFIFILLTFCIKKYFKNIPNSLIILLSSFILLSPYFRTSVFWSNQEHLAILFFIISCMFLKLNNYDLKNKIKLFCYPILSSLFGFLAFYVDQKFFFMPIIVYFFFVYKNSLKFFFLFSIINFLFFIPAIYLFYQWGGIVPLDSQFRIRLTPVNFNIFISNIGVYFIPFLLLNFYEKKKDYLKLKKAQILFLLVTTCLIYVFLPEQALSEGGGFIFRLLYEMHNNSFIFQSWFYVKLTLFIINIGFVYLILIFLEINFKSLTVMISLASIYMMTYFTYQSYVDPVIFIMFYILLNVKNINLVNQKFVYISGIFYTLILLGSITFRGVIA